MNSNEDPSQKPSGRLSPDELAGEVAKRLKRGRTERGEHRHRRFDIVTVSRIGMGIGIVLVAVGALFAVAWISRLAGFETPGTVIEETPVFGCPGEPETGVLFSGETVHLVGVSEDRMWYAVRDERGPDDVVYADALQIDPEGDVTQLEVRPCEPRDASAIAVAAGAADEVPSTANSLLVTIVGGAETTPTVVGSSPPPGRPPRRGGTSPGTTTPTTTTTTEPGPGPSSTATTVPGSPSTSGPGSSTSSSSTTTAPSTTSTPPTSTSTTTVPEESTTTVPEEPTSTVPEETTSTTAP